MRPPVGPALPWLREVPEVNVRTYVVGPGGRLGVWFFSLDIATPDTVAAARAEHERWPLRHATVRELDDRLPFAAGLPAPDGTPVAHYSPGVRVRIGFPRPVLLH